MSHIVRGVVDLTYSNQQVLRKALESIGKVLENEQATIATGGGGHVKSGERYPLVLQARENELFRIGFKREANGGFVPFYDTYGQLGDWCGKAMGALHDRYIAYHYEQKLTEEGYKVNVRSLADGSLEVEALEAAW